MLTTASNVETGSIQRNTEAKQNDLKYGDMFEHRKQLFLVFPTRCASDFDKDCCVGPDYW